MSRREINLDQVEDEMRQAEAYLVHGIHAPSIPTSSSSMSESRRKEILAKLNAERQAVRQKSINGPPVLTPQDEIRSPSTFLDSNAFFPLPPPTAALDCDDDDMAESDDGISLSCAVLTKTLFFASDIGNLPLPPQLPLRDPSEVSYRPAQSPKRTVRFLDTPDTPKSDEQETIISNNQTLSRQTIDAKPNQLANVCKPRKSLNKQRTILPPRPRPELQRTMGSKPNRINELAQSIDYASRERQKVAKELATLSSCSFHPTSTSNVKTPEKKASTRAATSARCSPPKKAKVVATAERLHVEGALRFELRDKVKQVLDDQQMRATCTFKPQINLKTQHLVNRAGHKPIYARLPEIQRQKKELLRQLEEAIQHENELTFAPEINPKSVQLTQDLSTMDVTTRLVTDAEEAAEKKLHVQAYYNALQEPSFCPQVNNKSQTIVESKAEFKLDFVKRQEMLQAQMEQKFQAKLALEEHAQAQDKPFRPSIGNANAVLQHTRPKRLIESTTAALYRMTYEEPRKREMTKQQLKEAQLAKYPHKPALNPVSKALGRPTSLDNLAKKEPKKTIRSRIVKAMEEKEQAECRFKPDLADLAPIDRTTIWNPATCLQEIELARRLREQKLNDERQSREFEQLQACTFAPTINRDVKTSKKPVVVRGLGRFLELKELAKRQENEQRQREAKVFTQTKDYKPRAYTVPAPFHLISDERANQRRERRIPAASEVDECTFHPKTLEHANRRLIERLVEHSNLEQ
ncbi:hypothetical protein LEN26_017542 [Aphanomyces euteiches]|nr:hypothetical protein LEN26_017542 [Aphanomyces euteiches]KAH9104524.1 hypothetical protein AeMF1_019410 [Aphanomyces euteiches]KAH9193336.1 hypothetical protein AeNC1_004684 [Aphanomyces euteiches]